MDNMKALWDYQEADLALDAEKKRYAKENGLEFLDMAKTPFVDVPENEWYFLK